MYGKKKKPAKAELAEIKLGRHGLLAVVKDLWHALDLLSLVELEGGFSHRA